MGGCNSKKRNDHFEAALQGNVGRQSQKFGAESTPASASASAAAATSATTRTTRTTTTAAATTTKSKGKRGSAATPASNNSTAALSESDAERERLFERSVRDGEPRWDLDLGDERCKSIIDRIYDEVRDALDLSLRRHDDESQNIRLWRVVKCRALMVGLNGGGGGGGGPDALEDEEAQWKGALQFCKEAKNPPLDLAECFANLGRFYEEKRKDFVKAEQMYRSGVDEAQAGLGREDDPRLAPYLRLIPDLLLNKIQGRFSEAVFLYERTLNTMADAESLEAAEINHALFKCLSQMRGAAKKAEAVKRAERAIELYGQNLGTDHPRTRFVVSEYESWQRAPPAPRPSDVGTRRSDLRRSDLSAATKSAGGRPHTGSEMAVLPPPGMGVGMGMGMGGDDFFPAPPPPPPPPPSSTAVEDPGV